VLCVAKMKGGAKVARSTKIASTRPAAKIASAEPTAKSANGARAANARSSSRPAENSKAAPRAKPASEKSAAKPASAATVASGHAGAAVTRPVAEPTAAGAPPTGALAGQRDEMIATRDVGRLLHYGERLGADTIDIRMLPLQLHIASGTLAVFDPGVPDTWHVLDRPIGRGAFRVMLSVARPDASEGSGERGRERLAAVAIHAGRPPIAKWTVAHFRGQPRPTSPDALPRTVATTGWIALLDAGDGPPGVLALPPASGLAPIEVPLTDGRRAIALPCNRGEFTAYWAVDASDRPICAVIDLDAFPHKAWKAKPPARSP
jgi:hypothetical protein